MRSQKKNIIFWKALKHNIEQFKAVSLENQIISLTFGKKFKRIPAEKKRHKTWKADGEKF